MRWNKLRIISQDGNLPWYGAGCFCTTGCYSSYSVGLYFFIQFEFSSTTRCSTRINNFSFSYHKSLYNLQDIIGYKFKNIQWLNRAMTHPSAVYNYGENPDQIRNSLTNCGIRKPHYGVEGTKPYEKKRGIVTLIKGNGWFIFIEQFYNKSFRQWMEFRKK